jgi:transaldolase
MPEDGGDCEAVLARFAEAGVDITALAERLQDDGAQAFARSWSELMTEISGVHAEPPTAQTEKAGHPLGAQP